MGRDECPDRGGHRRAHPLQVAFSQGQDAGQEAGAFSGRLEGAEYQRIVDEWLGSECCNWEHHYGRPSSMMSDLQMSGIVHMCSNYASEQWGSSR